MTEPAGHERRYRRSFACGAALTAAALALTWVASAAGAAVNVSGSAYVDYFAILNPSAKPPGLTGITPEVAVKLEVDVHDSLAFSAKACMGCHGLEVERAYLDFTPNQYVNLQVGRLPVPFGDFATRADPANHRTPSKPLPFEMGRALYFGRDSMNLSVVPIPYVDTGALLYGQVWVGPVQVWYGGYVVAGLRGENELDFLASRTPYYADNNRAPSFGGRAVATYAASSPTALVKDVSLGVSGMYGRYDRAMRLSYAAFGADATARLGVITVRGEYAFRRTDVNPALPGYRYVVIDPFIDKSGFYGEVEHPMWPLGAMVYRVDGLFRAGIPLPESDLRQTPSSRILRGTVAYQVPIADALFAKLDYEYWWPNDFPAVHAGHVGLGGSF